MEVKAQGFEDVVVLCVDGRIDFSNTKEFEDAFFQKLAEIPGEQTKVLLDLGGVSYMSSSGLRVLMLAAKQFHRKNGEIVVAALQPMLREVFKISRFDKIFKVYETVPAGLDDLSSAARAAYNTQS